MNLFTVTKFDFINTIKNPFLVISNTIVPMITIGVLGSITEKSYGASNISSYDYYAITMLVYTCLLVSQITVNAFMEKRIVEGNLRIMYSPTPKADIYLSKIIATFIYGVIGYIAVSLIEQGIFKMNVGESRYIYVLLVMTAFLFFSTCFGAFMCCLFRSEEVANKILSLINLIFAAIGGALFPIDNFGNVVQKLSDISPMKWMIECVFGIIYDNDFSLFMPLILVFIAISIIFIIVCQITFKPEEYV